MRGSVRNHASHGTLEAVRPLEDLPASAHAFESNEGVYVQIIGPETARALHIEVRLDSASASESLRPRRAPGQDERSTYRIHPDATPC
jgi:hypothetical protein